MRREPWPNTNCEIHIDGIRQATAPDGLHLNEINGNLAITISGPRPISTLTLVWKVDNSNVTLVLGDAWERGYGDLQWAPIDPARTMPWYVVLRTPTGFTAFGVKTRPNALVSWNITQTEVQVTFDLRSGRRPLALGERELAIGELVNLESKPEESAFEFVERLCSALCENPRILSSPVYGANDWYYAYGNNSRDGILADTHRTATWAGTHPNRPYSVIDAGWQIHGGCEGGPWIGNERFGNMGHLADQIREAGCRPGIWIRPLLTREEVPTHWLMRDQTLDPSQPQALQKAVECIAQCAARGYDLIKHDFTTWDCTRLWGFEMDATRHAEGGDFADDSRTSAEIYLALYDAIRAAAGESVLIGCNTWGHLTAGTHEIQRTGDDTSGKEWARTLKMGVNTLAFRAVQHNRFFAADADCVGLTDQIPWQLNSQWLHAVAASGTPLFVSANAKALTPEIEGALANAFALAAEPMPLAEPLDWMDTLTPAKWKQGSEVQSYNWTP